MKPLMTCLWFDTQAEEAAKFYVSVFKNAKLGKVSRYGKAGYETHRMKDGTVMVAEFELNGHPFMALNGGPIFKFNEAISLVVRCKTQEEIDHYWNTLGEGREGQCGWIKDKYGLSWQIVPENMSEVMSDRDKTKSQRVMAAVMQMKKLDIATLKRAYDGK